MEKMSVFEHRIDFSNFPNCLYSLCHISSIYLFSSWLLEELSFQQVFYKDITCFYVKNIPRLVIRIKFGIPLYNISEW